MGRQDARKDAALVDFPKQPMPKVVDSNAAFQHFLSVNDQTQVSVNDATEQSGITSCRMQQKRLNYRVSKRQGDRPLRHHRILPNPEKNATHGD